jgi:protochlorophyllide reductase
VLTTLDTVKQTYETDWRKNGHWSLRKDTCKAAEIERLRSVLSLRKDTCKAAEIESYLTTTVLGEDDTKKKRVLITGSNSGIGLDAAQRMVVRGHEVVLACVSFFVIVLYIIDVVVQREKVGVTHLRLCFCFFDCVCVENITIYFASLSLCCDNCLQNLYSQRTLDKAIAAVDKIKSNIANNAKDAVDANSLLKSLKLIPMECNLADLSSIDAFVNNLTTITTNNNNKNINNNKNNNHAFDAVCYNAGIARNIDAKDVARTKDGFELTVGTNHLGHFYLNHLLLKANLIHNNNESRGAGGGGGRIVVTSSSVHVPESPGGAQGATATLGDLQGLEYAVSNGSRIFDMVDGGPFNADKAYKDSKLCNVLFVRELQRRLDRNNPDNNIKVNCFTPGLIVGTGLFRDQNQVFTKVFDIAATNVLKVGETTHYGGGALEYMTLSKKVGEKSGELYFFSPPGSSKYGDDAFGKQFDVSKVSKEAQESDSNGKAKRLWELSEQLVGIVSPM